MYTSSPTSVILSHTPLPPSPSPWPTVDPFLFCVHHNDEYPAGDERLAPRASLAGRRIGSDFSARDGWSMYHGEVVPGFPEHPHRGFETVTLARRGYIDHSDSLGATARFGQGDAQWMTAGAGVVHSEMFPLVRRDAPNPTELFQIWLNLPRADKMTPAYFTMLWSEELPTLSVRAGGGGAGGAGEVRRVAASVTPLRDLRPSPERPPAVELTAVAGRFGGVTPPSPPPSSWASRPESAVAIWSMRFEAGSAVTLPPAPEGARRTLYVFEGAEGASLRAGVASGDEPLSPPLGPLTERASVGHAVSLRPEAPAHLRAEGGWVEALLLQGRPIGEPVVQHGPFVMCSRDEIMQTIRDYQRTGFGGWGWGRRDPVHAREAGRFAVHADGREERRG